MGFKDTVELVGKALDAAGVAVIVAGIVLATVVSLRRFRTTGAVAELRQYRRGIGRAILLGLEILVAADIIRTVAVNPTFQSAGVLAIIVAIRTFLSFSLEVELEGRWPWRAARERSAADGRPSDGGGAAANRHRQPMAS